LVGAAEAGVSEGSQSSWDHTEFEGYMIVEMGRVDGTLFREMIVNATARNETIRVRVSPNGVSKRTCRVLLVLGSHLTLPFVCYSFVQITTHGPSPEIIRSFSFGKRSSPLAPLRALRLHSASFSRSFGVKGPDYRSLSCAFFCNGLPTRVRFPRPGCSESFELRLLIVWCSTPSSTCLFCN
jgi:hypothetical protein